MVLIYFNIHFNIFHWTDARFVDTENFAPNKQQQQQTLFYIAPLKGNSQSALNSKTMKSSQNRSNT